MGTPTHLVWWAGACLRTLRRARILSGGLPLRLQPVHDLPIGHQIFQIILVRPVVSPGLVQGLPGATLACRLVEPVRVLRTTRSVQYSAGPSVTE